ncbi:uncharacterized protein [Amphiura filiformis]|uniref:uncharacterized protein n=1 Tax=Amphiura filiformis TaxID=82378 RepID=UPI003B2242BC
MATVAINAIKYKHLTFREKIGEGGFGTVNRVTFSKRYDGYKEAAAKSVWKMEQKEIQIMSQLSHQHVVRLIGFSQSGPMHVILMEYAPNGSLHDYLSDSSKPLTNALKQKWAVESALAIQYLHDQNYLHRDIKPSNCLLFEDNLLKICDFGLARKIEHSETTSSQKGTVRYMAPEIHVGNEHGRAIFSKPADIYAYGMLILEICTRKPPFQTWEWHKVVFEVGNGTQPTVPEDCPRHLSSIMQQCWNKDPKQRPTIASVLKALLKGGNKASYIWSLEREIKDGHVFRVIQDIAFNPLNGDLVAADSTFMGESKIHILDSDGKYKQSCTVTGRVGELGVIDTCASQNGNVLVIGPGSKSIHVFDAQGKYLHDFNTLTQDEDPDTPVRLQCMSADREGQVLVGDNLRDVITIHTCPDDRVVKKIKCSLGRGASVVVNGKNQILIHYDPTDSLYTKVQAIDYSGNELFHFIPRFDEDIAGNRVWSGGIVCDDDNNIYIALRVSYTGNTGHIHVYSPTGTFIKCIERGLFCPQGLSTTPDGSLAVANHESILLYSPILSTP